MEVADGKNQMRDCGGIADSLDVKGARDWVHVYLAVQIAGLDAEYMAAEFPEIKANTDDNRKLRVNAGKIARNNGVKGTHNGQFAAVLLGKVTKGK